MLIWHMVLHTLTEKCPFQEAQFGISISFQLLNCGYMKESQKNKMLKFSAVNSFICFYYYSFQFFISFALIYSFSIGCSDGKKKITNDFMNYRFCICI